ncbi:helix-turn-helix transcriptional regulator [Streptococcus parauberis]|uniref:helix-turn-helix transcriptional regulator n=1 Tax=Streptococcus parauberis TaxID=1348 RepID=UPI0002E79035|nr:helix-turn-helix transcriptional regulator [Streptococcus parauberis]QBX27442.1 DNA-binding protein [Streptococcus phage Javan386]UWM90937.1 helix-turn-helix transcriptional regulator [Streptococcus parauberis]
MKNRIKELREQNNLTQEELANKINVTKLTISNWENDKNKIKSDDAKELAKIFGVSIDYLVGYVNENKNVEHDSDFVKITTAEFNDLWKARQELYDLKIALRILKNAMAFATNEEIEEKND